MTTLTFDESAAEDVLKAFGKDVDDEGYLVDQESEERETNQDGEEIQKEHFAGIEQGSLIFVDDDFNSLVAHVNRRQEK